MLNHNLEKTKNETKLSRLPKIIISKNLQPKIVGDIRHYPPANKEWKNSIYAYNKNSLRSLPALDKIAARTIKSYFSLSNNKKLARSRRMRNLIRRRSVKRLFVSKPEIKQTSDKVNITVYTFNRERQFFLRKMYFYNLNMNISKNIYLYKLWWKNNLLAFKKTFKDRKTIIPYTSLKKSRIFKNLMTKRRKRNKTYIHNILLKRYFLSKFSNGLSKKDKKSVLVIGKAPKNVRNSIKKNLLKSLKKRNFIRLLKKRENQKRILAIPLKTISTQKNNTDPIKNTLLQKPFNNYLIRKISTKTKFKLRSSNSIMKKVRKLKRLKRFRFTKIRLPYSNLKFKNEIRFFSFKLVSELKYIRKLFKFYYIKYLLDLLDISIIPIKRDSGKKNETKSFYLAEKKRYLINLYNIKNKLVKRFKGMDEIVKQFNVEKNTIEYYIDTGKLFKNKYYIKLRKRKLKSIIFKNIYSYDKLKNIEQLNLELLHFLKKVLLKRKHLIKIKNNKNSFFYTILFTNKEKNNIDFLYKNFAKKYFLKFLAKFFKKEFLYINYYSKFLINQLKFGKFLPGLKIWMSKIYSKKVELNLVNLKYPHLNSDIYTEAIATKLRRKVGLLKVLKWSLNLARLPSDYLPNNKTEGLNTIPYLTIHKSLDLNFLSEGGYREGEKNEQRLNEDKLHSILNKVYPSSLAHLYSPFTRQINGQLDAQVQISKKNKKKSNNTILDLFNKQNKIEPKKDLMKSLTVLNIIKYKWVSGVRLEAAGRLTRRYTAARSVFKFRYKGNLKNIDYSQKLDPSKKNMSTVMLRNYVKSNSQYSFAKSKRRIGAYGLKAWIGSY